METAISNFCRRWYDQQSVTWLVGTGIGGCKTALLSQLPTARISKTVSPRIIQPSSHQSRNTHRLAISLPRFESFGFPFLGSVAQQHVHREQPDTIEALIQCASAFAAIYDSGTIRKVSKNVLKSAKRCSHVNGDHFQHLLK